MKEINIDTFARGVSETFRRYLATTNLIADSEPFLRDEIWRQLSQPDLFARKPLVTAIPAYKSAISGSSILGIASKPNLSSILTKLSVSEFDLNRPLYEHQLTSLAKAQDGRSFVVATGTGSGKTECFLLPVLDDAATFTGKGVRTIVIYPMNALANDQLDRLRRLLVDVPEITFGRYTGETPQNRTGISAEELEHIASNERYSRDEIQNDPPHVLLTNFAMLEYLLLRPRDAGIFRHGTLRYVILDEAHSYNGAQGIDIAMLMRRLAERYSERKLQFILTSATLTQEENADSRSTIANFGQTLTGAEFSADDVIFGSPIHGFSDRLRRIDLESLILAVPTEESFQKWLDALEKPSELKLLIANSGLPNATESLNHSKSSEILFSLLQDWEPLKQLHEAVSNEPYSMDRLASLVWDRNDSQIELVLKWLLTLGAYARRGGDGPPLLPARFHLFFRGINGASVCMSPLCSNSEAPQTSRVRTVYLESRVMCDTPCESLLLPLLTCFQCGLPVVKIFSTDGNRSWQPIAPSNSPEAARQLFLTWDSKNLVEDESSSDDDTPDEQQVTLCLRCNRMAIGSDIACCSDPVLVGLSNIPTAADGNLKACPRCGASSRPYPSVLREFRTGGEASTAVLGEQVVRQLPEDLTGSGRLPGGGRRMLAFSDSRQRAAFFAPYLKRTTAETEYARPLYDALRTEEEKNEGPADIESVVGRFSRNAMSRPWVILRKYDEDSDLDAFRFVQSGNLQQADRRDLKRQATIALLKHFCAGPRQRTTWVGLGLASSEIDLTENDIAVLKESLPELFMLDDGRGLDLIQQLLQVFLIKRAIYIDDDAISKRDIGKGPQDVSFHYSLNDQVNGRSRIRWNPYEATRVQDRTILGNYQATIVGRFFGLNPLDNRVEMKSWLERIWNGLRASVLKQYSNAGGEYQLDAAKIVLTTLRAWSQCDSCGRLTVWHLNGQCNVPRCAGRLERLSASELEAKFANYHYRHRILHEGPMALEVVEHTAQLTNKHGQEYQKKFVNGEINVLSSSTTFEMGVDVGGLKAVLLRNVPPTASNYIQRAGRAGRRRDGAAYAVTFARSIPHDQFHFHNPTAIVNGKVPIPQINLKNTRLVERHVNSLLISEFFRGLPAETSIRTVQDFFLTPEARETVFDKYLEFLSASREAVISAVERILPPASSVIASDAVDLSGDALRRVADEKVHEPLSLYKAQWEQINAQRNDADTNELGRITYALKSVERLITDLKNEQLIDFLSSAHWLPSYAFPQSTIRLLVRQNQWADKMRLERDRDQGISEYAPGAEIIADGKSFRSAGAVRPGNGFDLRKYRYCRRCRRLVTAAGHETIQTICQCGASQPPNDYIVPIGFQTHVNDQVKEPDLFRRQAPSSTEIFLISGTPDEQFVRHSVLDGVLVGNRRDGRLFRANAGLGFQKFRLCRECGRSFGSNEKVGRQHEAPWGTRCQGSIFNTHLAHEFETDILQIRFGSGPLMTPPVSNDSFWLSLVSGFLTASAEVLEIPRNDLDATYQSQNRDSSDGELIIFDRVPGGAGYVERIIENLPRILERVRDLSSNCENPICDKNSSCYACLRTFQNQFYWDKLVRQEITDWNSKAHSAA